MISRPNSNPAGIQIQLIQAAYAQTRQAGVLLDKTLSLIENKPKLFIDTYA